VATACRLTTDVLALWLCSQRTAGHMAGMSGLAVIESPRYADETEACGHAESVSRPCHIRKVLPSRRFRGQPHRLATKGRYVSQLLIVARAHSHSGLVDAITKFEALE
jgi:hypothetical protein